MTEMQSWKETLHPIRPHTIVGYYTQPQFVLSETMKLIYVKLKWSFSLPISWTLSLELNV